MCRFGHKGGLRVAQQPLVRHWASLHQQPGLAVAQLERDCVRLASAHQMRQRAVTGVHERPRRDGATANESRDVLRHRAFCRIGVLDNGFSLITWLTLRAAELAREHYGQEKRASGLKRRQSGP